MKLFSIGALELELHQLHLRRLFHWKTDILIKNCSVFHSAYREGNSKVRHCSFLSFPTTSVQIRMVMLCIPVTPSLFSPSGSCYAPIVVLNERTH